MVLIETVTYNQLHLSIT